MVAVHGQKKTKAPPIELNVRLEQYPGMPPFLLVELIMRSTQCPSQFDDRNCCSGMVMRTGLPWSGPSQIPLPRLAPERHLQYSALHWQRGGKHAHRHIKLLSSEVRLVFIHVDHQFACKCTYVAFM